MSYLPINLAGFGFFIGYNMIEDLAVDLDITHQRYSEKISIEEILINNIFTLCLWLGISHDIYRNAKVALLPSALLGLVLTFLIERLLVAYIPASMGFNTHTKIQIQPTQIDLEKKQFDNSTITDDLNLNISASPTSFTEKLVCSSASRTISTPIWLKFISAPFKLLKLASIPIKQSYQFFGNLPNSPGLDSTTPKSVENIRYPNLNGIFALLLIPAAKFGAARQNQFLTQEELGILNDFNNQLLNLKAERINPVMRKIHKHGYSKESVFLDLIDMHNRIHNLINQAIKNNQGSKFLFSDVERFMGYLEKRLNNAESFLESYRFFNLPYLNDINLINVDHPRTIGPELSQLSPYLSQTP